ncbi:hypothetical protein EDB80DRAFT_421978 [Ilyonectria destructans]|nr:hypothetical protein EDB80DRAFT_421978 [Ilyonectria destructans]
MTARSKSSEASPPLTTHNSISCPFLDKPSLLSHGRLIVVTTSYLHGAVRPSHDAFHFPSDAEKTLLLCAGASSDIAPFRDFMQERVAARARAALLRLTRGDGVPYRCAAPPHAPPDASNGSLTSGTVCTTTAPTCTRCGAMAPSCMC